MVAEEPEVAGLRRRLVGWLGDVVGVGQARPSARPARAPASIAASASESTVTSARSSRSFASSVVAIAASGSRLAQDEPLLVLGEVDVEDGDGRLAAADREGDAEVAVDDVSGARLTRTCCDPADLVEDAGQRLLLGLRMDAPVRRVGEQLVGCLRRRSRRCGSPTQGRRTRQGSTRPGCRTAHRQRVNRDTARLYGKPNRKTVAREASGCALPHDEGVEGPGATRVDVGHQAGPMGVIATSPAQSSGCDGPRTGGSRWNSKLSTVIDRPVHVVWDFYAVHHVENHPRWDPSLELEATSDDPIGVGTVIKRRATRFGRTTEGTMAVVEFEPERAMRVETHDGPMIDPWLGAVRGGRGCRDEADDRG